MSRIVHLTASAEADLDETVAWIFERSPQAAANWHARILDKIQTLEENADRYALADEAADLAIPLQEMLFGKRSGVFRILYTIDGDRVNIIRIRRASRDRLKPDDV